MLPTREEALKLIRDGLLFNPGPWGKHCLTAAHCAEKIASACGDMDVEKAYILGLLHDIGRKFDVTDEFYVRASRIEIPASITATEFYRKFGYDYKNGVKELDNEHHYRLEKFKEAGLK